MICLTISEHQEMHCTRAPYPMCKGQAAGLTTDPDRIFMEMGQRAPANGVSTGLGLLRGSAWTGKDQLQFTSTVPRFMSSALICLRRSLSPSISKRRLLASVPVTRQPTSAKACGETKTFHLWSELPTQGELHKPLA